MKYVILKWLTLCATLFFASVFADTAPLLQQAKNYAIVNAKNIPKDFTVPKGKILVLDFFSYGCPHCAKLAPYLDAWKKTNTALLIPSQTPDIHASTKNSKQAYIIFQPVPVAFEAGWEIYAKAYHIAEVLNKSSSLSQSLFAVAQNSWLNIHNYGELESFFNQHSIANSDYVKAADPQVLKQKLAADAALLKSFKIVEIPTVLVANGTNVYLISNTTVAHADPKIFVDTLTLLTQQKPKK